MSTLELTHTQEGDGAVALNRLREQLRKDVAWTTQQWPNIQFTGGGSERLASISGWLLGLAQSGREEEAKRYAQNLFDKLDYLNTYGGTQMQENDGFVQAQEILKPVEVPRYRVQLSDDCTLHGFYVVWHRHIPIQNILDSYGKYSSKRASEMGVSVEDWESSSQHVENAMRLAREEWKVQKDLTLTRWAHHKWDTEKSYSTTLVQTEYGVCMQGALLYHGPGKGENFSVCVGKSENVWRIHT